MPDGFSHLFLLLKTTFLYCSLFIFYNFHHGIPFLFHVRHQFELCSCTIQIVIFPVNLEIMIPLQIIRKKTHTTLICHDLRAHRKHLDLCAGKTSSASFLETVVVHFKQPHTASLLFPGRFHLPPQYLPRNGSNRQNH